MEEFEVKRRGIPTTDKFYETVNKMVHHMKKELRGEGIRQHRFDNRGTIWAGIPGFIFSPRL